MSRPAARSSSPLEFPANDAGAVQTGSTDHLGIVLPEARLRVLGVGGTASSREKIRALIDARRRAGGLHAVVRFVDHSREALEAFERDRPDVLLVYDDLTGRTVLAWARESERTIPCVCICDESGPSDAKRRYEQRRSGAQVCIFSRDLCEPVLELALRQAVEGAVARDRARRGSGSGERWVTPAALERELDVAMSRSRFDPAAKLRVVYVEAGEIDRVATEEPAMAASLRTEFEQRLARAADGLLLGRDGVGGTVVLVPSTNTDIAHLDALHRIQAVASKPYEYAGQRVSVEIGVGIVIVGANHGDASEVLAEARTRARSRDVGTVDAAALSGTFRAKLEPDPELGRRRAQLRSALERDEFSLSFQPIVDLVRRRLMGFEALMRWNTDAGTVAAAEFIADAERSDLICALGYWALETAIRQAQQWGAEFDLDGRFSLHINLSTRQVADHRLVERIRSLLLTTGVDPRMLCFEIQADSIVHAPVEAERLVRALAEDAAAVCVEDFGLGRCTVDELRRLPISSLKIDRRFVLGLDGTSATIGRVSHVADAAKALGVDLVAEGIENELQRNVLRSLGCRTGQGYLFDRPMTLGSAYARLARSFRSRDDHTVKTSLSS